MVTALLDTSILVDFLRGFPLAENMAFEPDISRRNENRRIRSH